MICSHVSKLPWAAVIVPAYTEPRNFRFGFEEAIYLQTSQSLDNGVAQMLKLFRLRFEMAQEIGSNWCNASEHVFDHAGYHRP